MEIDYLTLTSSRSGRNEVWIPEGFHQTENLSWQAGPAVYTGSLYKYENGTLQVLWSDLQGLLIRISGGLGELFFRKVDIKEYKLTRIDIKKDIKEDIDLLFWYRKQKEMSEKVKATLINNETLYIGSRKSMRFWRIYNKAAEQGLEEILFRIELELKDVRAEQAKYWINTEEERKTLFKKSCIGIMAELLDSVGFSSVSEGDLTLPRKKPSERLFFKKVIIPFLRKNKWAVEELSREGLYE